MKVVRKRLSRLPYLYVTRSLIIFRHCKDRAVANDVLEAEVSKTIGKSLKAHFDFFTRSFDRFVEVTPCFFTLFLIILRKLSLPSIPSIFLFGRCFKVINYFDIHTLF